MIASQSRTATARGNRVPGALSARTVLATIPGALVIGLMVLWAADNGGYDQATWYWGALVILATFAAVVVVLAPASLHLSRPVALALTLLSLYVGWSYLSITWAQSKGDALLGSNRALLFLLLFALMAILPWTARRAQLALLAFALAIGVMALVILVRLASTDHVQSLIIDGRLVAPTGYFNSTVALFMMGALLSTVLAVVNGLPALVRGVLLASATACLQLCIVGQSRGWVFTLPLVLLIAIVIAPNRLWLAAAALLPAAAAVIPVHRLLAVYAADTQAGSNHAAARAGHSALLLSAAVFVVGTIVVSGGRLVRLPRISDRGRRWIGTAMALTVLVLSVAGFSAATHGDPTGFIKRQWKSFSHPTMVETSGSHFGTLGSSRYDFWRVALHASITHPIAGLGQDNFLDYYLPRRRTGEQPQWTHSWELRLLVHTGIVGFLLFVGFLITALAGAARALRVSDRRTREVAAVALLPLVVWLVHGSVDWFWEMPALTAPAFGFLAIAGALGRPTREVVPGNAVNRRRWIAAAAAGAVMLPVATIVLGFPYLAAQEVSAANRLRAKNPVAALEKLADAARLNPLSALPGRIGGTVALQAGLLTQAERRFHQAISREPGGWYAWFGEGLAASSLGDNVRAYHDFKVAAGINSREPAIAQALERVNTGDPLDPNSALRLLLLNHPTGA